MSQVALLIGIIAGTAGILANTILLVVGIRKQGNHDGELSETVAHLATEVGYLRTWREETTSLLSRVATLVDSLERRVQRLEDAH